jgi:transcription-repair coupling factor (superfamily II helicase)
MESLTLRGLLPILREHKAYKWLVEKLRERNNHPLPLELAEPARPFVFAALLKDLNCPIVIIVSSAEKARRYYEELRSWTETPEDVLLFKEPDALPYEREPWGKETIAQRLEVLFGLPSTSPLTITPCL